MNEHDLKRRLFSLMFTSLSKRDIVIFFIVSFLSLFLFGFNTGQRWGPEFGAAYIAINMAASLFTLGIPISLGVAFLLCTKLARSQIRLKYESQTSPQLIILSRFFILVILVLIVMFFWTLFSFVYAVGLYTTINSAAVFNYFPTVFLTGIIITLLTCGVTIVLSILVDSSKFSILVCLFFFFILSSVFDFSPYVSSHDHTKLFSPYHLFRFLSVILSASGRNTYNGAPINSPDNMSMIMGMYVSSLQLIIPLLFWIGLTCVCLFSSIYILRWNLQRWILENELDSSITEIGVEMDVSRTQSVQKTLKEGYTKLRNQRLLVATVLISVLLLLPMARSLSQSQAEAERTEVLYQSPLTGETLPLGQWRYGVVEVSSPPIGFDNFRQVYVEIMIWGDCPEELESASLFRKISLETFETANDTQRENMCTRWSRSITRDNPYTGGGWSSLEGTGTFLWAFKFVPAPGYDVVGTLTVIITVSIQAM